jgi:excisionase family DNA binding protein
MTSNDLGERLMTPEETALYLGYKVGTVYNKANRDELPYVKLGHALRFRRSELDAWVKKQDSAARAAKVAERGAA